MSNYSSDHFHELPRADQEMIMALSRKANERKKVLPILSNVKKEGYERLYKFMKEKEEEEKRLPASMPPGSLYNGSMNGNIGSMGGTLSSSSIAVGSTTNTSTIPTVATSGVKRSRDHFDDVSVPYDSEPAFM